MVLILDILLESRDCKTESIRITPKKKKKERKNNRNSAGKDVKSQAHLPMTLSQKNAFVWPVMKKVQITDQ